MKKILCICLSATYQRSISFSNLVLERVNRSHHYGLYASGKAVNTARIIAQLEKDSVITICPLGENNCDEFIELSEKDNLNLRYVKVPGKIRECWTLLDRTSNTTTEIVVGEPVTYEDGKPIWSEERSNSAEIKLLKLINEALPEVDGVILAGSKQGVWSKDLYTTIAGMAADAGKIFLADYLGEDLIQTLKVCPSTIVKVNDEEFCTTFLSQQENQNYQNEKIENKSEILKKLIVEKSKKLENTIIVTRGSDSTMAACNGTYAECESEKVEVVNTTACGDSFNAGFMYEFVNSGSFSEALKKGTWCAARNAEREAPGDVR